MALLRYGYLKPVQKYVILRFIRSSIVKGELQAVYWCPQIPQSSLILLMSSSIASSELGQCQIPWYWKSPSRVQISLLHSIQSPAQCLHQSPGVTESRPCKRDADLPLRRFIFLSGGSASHADSTLKYSRLCAHSDLHNMNSFKEKCIRTVRVRY